MVHGELCCPFLLAFLSRVFENLNLLASLGFLDHTDRAVDIMHDILGKLRVFLHLLDDGRKLFHGFRTELRRHSEIKHLDG